MNNLMKEANYKENSGSKIDCCKNCIHCNGKDLCSGITSLRIIELKTLNGICEWYENEDEVFRKLKGKKK